MFRSDLRQSNLGPTVNVLLPQTEIAIEFADQYGALPWRRRKDGAIEVMLVTSRVSRHWLIPKGWRISGKTECSSALREAYEEAGVRGDAKKQPLGQYRYTKVLKDGTSTPCIVTVFGLKVRKAVSKWPEAEQRTRQWFALEEAVGAVNEPGLAAFLAKLGQDDFAD